MLTPAQITEIFCLVDDFCKQIDDFIAKDRHSIDFMMVEPVDYSKFSIHPSEIITLQICFQQNVNSHILIVDDIGENLQEHRALALGMNQLADALFHLFHRMVGLWNYKLCVFSTIFFLPNSVAWGNVMELVLLILLNLLFAIIKGFIKTKYLLILLKEDTLPWASFMDLKDILWLIQSAK